MENDVKDQTICLDYMKKRLIEHVKRMDESDVMFLRRIYISIDDYMREYSKRREK